MSATEVARNFSAVMNRVGAGEEIEIVRNGAPIAELRPPSKPHGISGSALKTMMAHRSHLDGDFARDVGAAGRDIWPAADQWPAS
ncbi:MAG: type II toxin-antitoxin system prevent-host-death family antitoxin [Solirubrobacterales bacterium]|nr:type II toxin-antitoxin system prevent-host-death family antitoxin [Solirubrobacterales bacterium]